MAATTSSAASTPPTPPSTLPIFARVTSAALLQRNASTSSSISTTTSESSSSLVAVPIRPPPIQTRTAATPEAQLPSDAATDYDDSEPRGHYGGRGFIHNGPRMKHTDEPARSWSQPPAIVTTSSPTSAAQSLPPSLSPVTPKAARLGLAESMPAPIPVSPRQLRVTIGDDDSPVSPARSRAGSSASPSTPTTAKVIKGRTHSVDRSSNPNTNLAEPRERRQSQLSTQSNGSAVSKRPSLRDYVLGKELGRGSYSTVVLATAAAPGGLSASQRATPQQFAIKIMNQAHLIQEKKAKYAHIERDALIRLAQPRSANSPTMTHRRGMSNSSANTARSSKTVMHARRDSGGTVTSAALSPRERQLESPTPFAQPLSPLAGTNRLTKEPQELLDDRPAVYSSRPPSPVKEESSDGQSDGGDALEPPLKPSKEVDLTGSQRMRTPRKRRQSLAPSERSTRSNSGGSQVFGHHGIIRLYSTFADKTSVYYVLELASNGELASVIRKLGSLDLGSAKFYAAQLIDTIEFIHEREIIHRDIKPENILLDADRRLKVTDFGSAKILGRQEGSPEETSKRSFVGSADYVSPEVLRNEPASFASDIWAFGVVVYNFITGKSPFRSATEFLTFQKVLKCELEFPEGFDPQAQSLVERCLHLDPRKRPSPQQIKSHPFFSGIDWTTIWQIPAPEAATGMTPPQETLASIRMDSDVWAVFDDDGSEGAGSSPREDPHSQEPQYDRYAAASAVKAVDNAYDEEFDPPRPGWLVGEPGPLRSHKPRGWSTSSSSSGGRLSGLLDAVGINPPSTPSNIRISSGRASRASGRNEEVYPYNGGSSPARSRTQSPESIMFRGVTHTDNSKWMPLLVANERIVISTPILVKPSNNVPLPAFLLPSSKRRQLIMTDLPRLLCVKEDPETGEAKIKYEFAFFSHPRARAASVRSNGSGGKGHTPEQSINYILEIQERGSKVFIVQTATHTFTFTADTADVRSAWMHTFRRVV